MNFLRYPDLRAKGISWSRVHIDRLEKAGRFPRRVRLSENTVAWRELEVDQFLADRIAERDRHEAAQ